MSDIVLEDILEALRAEPDSQAYIDNASEEECRSVGAEIIKAKARREGISEIDAMNNLAPFWVGLRKQAEEHTRIAEFLDNLIKICD